MRTIEFEPAIDSEFLDKKTQNNQFLSELNIIATPYQILKDDHKFYDTFD